ncbi:redoxin domain-containing protein [Nesterenkonia muleiensis]|uniref:redoxin domain-containing protein n=1 Tax=Nesterenkonia muleiensis TaxID=2282648 RepID=UPI00192E45AC|nr:redoxin domain-containing protein [Nesterenkonia muleiensis]
MDTARRRPVPGQPAPWFVLRNQHGESVELAALAGAPAVVMFFPLAFSRVCGAELSEIMGRWAEFAELRARLLAVSCDSVHTLRAFADELGGVPFDLLSDFWPHGAVSDDYGAFDQRQGFPARETFVLDAELTVRHRVSAAHDHARDLDQVLGALRM